MWYWHRIIGLTENFETIKKNPEIHPSIYENSVHTKYFTSVRTTIKKVK